MFQLCLHPWKSSLLLLSTVAVLATGAGAEERPLSNSGLPALEDIRKLQGVPTGSGIHNVKLGIEGVYSRAIAIGQPTRRDQSTLATTVTLSANIGQHVFAAISGTFARETIASTNLAFGLPMSATASAVAGDALIAVMPAPFLAIGVFGGYGSASASYQFTGFPGPATTGASDTRRIGGFVRGHVALNDWLLTGTVGVINIHTNVDFGPTNIPQFDTHGATVLLTDIQIAHHLTTKAKATAGVTLNQVLSQIAPAAQPGLDSTWLTVHAGLSYELNDQIEIYAKGAIWVGNSRMSFNQVSVGTLYRF